MYNKVDFIATPTRAEDKEVEYFMIPREVETIDSVLSDHAVNRQLSFLQVQSSSQPGCGQIILVINVTIKLTLATNVAINQHFPCNQCDYQANLHDLHS